MKPCLYFRQTLRIRCTLLTLTLVGATASAATVRGKINRESGEPAVGIQARLVAANSATSPYSFSDADGMVFFNQIPPGSYTIEIWATKANVLREKISVTDPVTDLRVFTLQAGGGAQRATLAEVVDGDWHGTAQGGGDPFVFHINHQGTSTSDIPAQKTFAVPVQAYVKDNMAVFTMLSEDASFRGTWDGARLMGKLQQHGQSQEVTLTKYRAGTAADVAKLAGNWAGAVTTTNLPLTLHVSPTGTTTVDSPRQRATGVAAQLAVSGSRVTIEIPYWGMTFDGTLSADAMSGNVTQYGRKYATIFKKQR